MSDPVRTVTLAYAGGSLSAEGSTWLGTTADNASDRIQIAGIPPGADAVLVYGITIRSDGRLIVPEQELDEAGGVLVNADVMRACTSGTLPVRLRLDWEDGAKRVMTNPITLTVALASPGSDTSRPETLTAAMTRISSWAWVETLTYKAGSIVAHGGRAWTSLQASNRGHEPVLGSEWWATFDVHEETLAGLRDAISAEATTRASADDALRASIGDNASAISAEVSARKAAVSAEATARAKAVSEEAVARASADTALRKAVDGKAPIAHASADTRYGAGTDKMYGHVRVAAALSSTGTDPVQGKAIAAALAAKQPMLSWDTSPVAGSAKPVTSGGIKTAIDAEVSARKAAVSAEATARAKAVSDEASARQEADESEASARQTADSALQASIDALGSAAHKNTGTSSGQVPILGAGGKLPNSVIPDLAISAYLGEAEDYAHLTALRGQQGDYAVVKGNSATSGTYIISSGTGSESSDWVRLSGPGDLTAGLGVTVSGSVISLSASGVTPGTKGSAVQVPVITVDQYGRITALGGTAIYPPTTAGTAGQVWRSDGYRLGVWDTPDAAPTADSSHLVTSGGTKKAVDAEASARAKAVSAEAQTRQTADSALQASIDAEAQARAGAVSDEASARQAADAALQTAVDGKQDPIVAGSDISIGDDGRTINASAQRPVAGAGIAVSGRTVALASSGATAGTYGGASAIPQLTVDAYGRVTKVSTVAPADQRPTAGTGIAVSGRAVSLADSGVKAGTYGGASAIPQLTVDRYGRITGASTQAIYPTTAGTAGQVWRSDGSGAGVWETPDAAPTADSSHLVTSGGTKKAVSAEATARAKAVSEEAVARASADTALRKAVDGKAAKTEALGTGTALSLASGTGARNLTLTRKTVSGASSTSVVSLPAATSTASGLMSAAQAVRLDAALPASTPQVYTATIPQTDYLDVCLAQYVRIGLDKGLLSISGHMRDISLPGDVWTLISIDTIMSAMGLTHRRPSAYRTTGWWHYDDGDDHGDRYGSGTVCQVSPSGYLELGRYYSGTQIGGWEMSNLGRNRYISVRDVYVEIQ